MDFWASERCQVRTLQASLHEKTLIYSAFSVFDLGYYWLPIVTQIEYVLKDIFCV